MTELPNSMLPDHIILQLRDLGVETDDHKIRLIGQLLESLSKEAQYDVYSRVTDHIQSLEENQPDRD